MENESESDSNLDWKGWLPREPPRLSTIAKRARGVPIISPWKRNTFFGRGQRCQELCCRLKRDCKSAPRHLSSTPYERARSLSTANFPSNETGEAHGLMIWPAIKLWSELEEGEITASLAKIEIKKSTRRHIWAHLIHVPRSSSLVGSRENRVGLRGEI